VNGDAADPFRCPNADRNDDHDHVLVPEPPPESARFALSDSLQPFRRHRELLWTYRLARSRGFSDADWVDLVGALDEKVARVDGHGFAATPFGPSAELATALGLGPGSVWVKDETGNVAGSHKARHLFGIALALEIRERTGLADPDERAHRELAIASCGNAALAAAVIARAAGRPLRAYVPCDASPRILARLADLGARVEVCRRRPGEAGDPCLAAYCAARTRGAVPFCVQGNENGLTIEGGATLAWEMAETFSAAHVAPDRVFVQTGGGALASACVAGLRLAVEHGLIPRLPRIHVVQTAAALPLRRAWERVAARVLEGSEERAPALPSGRMAPGEGHGEGAGAVSDREHADALQLPSRAGDVRDAMRHARRHRGRFMWPVERAPKSIAHGILDDETYDWAAVVEGTIESGGWPLTVSEPRLAAARTEARRATRIATDATGAAGLAGLMELSQAGAIDPDERVAVLFTGAER
jgi:threonine synthase